MIDSNSKSRAGLSGCDLAPFDVSVKRDGRSTLLVEVRGELDLATAPILKQHLEPYNDPTANNGHPLSIVYVLPELGFMDSTGLHCLLTAVDGHGPETITVREPSSSVRRLLELVGLDSMIEEPANR